ncbi:MAG: phosphoribosyltransferase family protein [Enterobacteriaceae bacterium]
MLFAASRCWLCHCPLTLSRQGFCGFCQQQLLQSPPCCPRCGLPSSHPHFVCGRCLQEPPPWYRLIAVSPYTQPLSHLVHRFKFHGQSELARPLARLMLLAWLQARRQQQVLTPDLLLAVPLSRRRQWFRGFNQSERLAHYLSHWLQRPFAINGLRRLRHTPVQRLLSGTQRRRNLHGAFACQKIPPGSHLLLLDDVVTTGSTMAEISRLLLSAGAQSVQVLCLCRTV